MPKKIGCEYCSKDLTGINHFTAGRKLLRFIPLPKTHYCDVNCYLLHALKLGVRKAEDLMVYMVQNPNHVNKIFGDGAGRFDVGRFICPLGAEARFCEHQKSYSRDMSRYIDDVDFYCVIGTDKCDRR